MGPLVPDIISNNLNYIVALAIGILFGMILEQAGFSSTKKLVGLFYGYDFTVLRVFFTAGLTAMVGVIAFIHFGLLDMNLVYINPTYFWSAIIGGLIMGLGFILGGYCPGTTFCAAAIGKLDAMIFIVGAFVGVFLFAEGYTWFEPLYKATFWGNPVIYDTLGISKTLFAFLLIIVAMIAFWLTTLLENKINKTQEPTKFTALYKSLVVIGLVMAVSVFALPDRKASLMNIDVNSVKNNISKMTVDELAYRLMDVSDDKLQIIDFRKIEEFKKFSLPKSTQFTIDNMFEKEPIRMLLTKHKINVLIAENEQTAIKYAAIAKELGYKNINVLEGGIENFKTQIIDYQENSNPTTIAENDLNRFRLKAKSIIPVLISENKNTGAVKKVQKRVIGGC